MNMNELFWVQTDVGAIIYYVLNRPIERIQGVINYSPYIIAVFIC